MKWGGEREGHDEDEVKECGNDMEENKARAQTGTGDRRRRQEQDRRKGRCPRLQLQRGLSQQHLIAPLT